MFRPEHDQHGSPGADTEKPSDGEGLIINKRCQYRRTEVLVCGGGEEVIFVFRRQHDGHGPPRTDKEKPDNGECLKHQ